MQKIRPNRKFLAGIFILLTCLSVEIYAVAYCALRDPVNAIQTFFPGFSSYRSILGIVGPELRGRLNEKLQYETHFNEFRKHTLYVAYRDDRAIGIVHARTEKGDWGLDELVWSLNMDLTIRDFRFQRSRSKWKTAVQSDEFKQFLRGKSIEDLTQLLSVDGTQYRNMQSTLPPGAEGMATTVVRSAMKTIVVTEYVWGQELQALQATD